jgi:hypothetical protein
LLTLRTALCLLPAKGDKIGGFLTRLLEKNRDPYLAHHVKPAIHAIRVDNIVSARRWLQRAVIYLLARLAHC